MSQPWTTQQAQAALDEVLMELRQALVLGQWDAALVLLNGIKKGVEVIRDEEAQS